MVIERDRFLDDSAQWRLSLGLTSRTASTHSLMSALTDEERGAISVSLTRALDEIVDVLRRKRATGPAA
jgi:hypothetical protein